MAFEKVNLVVGYLKTLHEKAETADHKIKCSSQQLSELEKWRDWSFDKLFNSKELEVRADGAA